MAENRYQDYLNCIGTGAKKVTRLEFLQPDGATAFALDNEQRRGYMRKYDSRAFVQSGSLSVNLQNGQRRKASVTLGNIDRAFDYAVNKVWFGNQIRLSMGFVLPDGEKYYIPQGVFYVSTPVSTISPTTTQITYNLVDKWARLDGTFGGMLTTSYVVEQNMPIFGAMNSVLQLNRFTLDNVTTDKRQMLDYVTPVFTDYYNGKSYVYKAADGTESTIPMTNTAVQTITEAGKTAADILLNLNANVVGLIGYDSTGTLRVEPSQDDISDEDKAILYTFDRENSTFLSLQETYKNTEVYNDVLIVGEGLQDYPVYGRATNYDPKSDTNVNIIGLRTYREEKSEYHATKMCQDYALWLLKRKTVLQKAISISSAQMFHLQENRLIAVKRTDKEGSPIEKHLIQSFTIPLAETGDMTITAVSVNDNVNATITSY